MTLAEFARRARFNAKKIERKITAMFEKITLTCEELEQMIPAKTANKKYALPSREIVARFTAAPMEHRRFLKCVYLNTEDNTIAATDGAILAIASDSKHKGENSGGCYEPVNIKFFADMEIKETFCKSNETLTISKKMYAKRDLVFPNYQSVIQKDFNYVMGCSHLIDKIPWLKALYHFGLNFGSVIDATNGHAVKLNLKCEKTGKEQTVVFKTENLLKIFEALRDTGMKNESVIYFGENVDDALVFENPKIKIVAMPYRQEKLKMEYIPTMQKMNKNGITHKTELAPGRFMDMIQEEQQEPAPVETETVKTEATPAPMETKTEEMPVVTKNEVVNAETIPESIVSCSMYADQSYTITIKTDIARIDGKTPMRAYKTYPAEYVPAIATASAALVKTEEASAPLETETQKGEKQTQYKFYCRRENDLNFIRLRAEIDGKTYPPEPVRKTDKLKNFYGGIAKTTAKAAAAIGAFLMNLP